MCIMKKRIAVQMIELEGNVTELSVGLLTKGRPVSPNRRQPAVPIYTGKELCSRCVLLSHASIFNKP